jgi:sigma-E factor negative regulatory protein RseA
MKTKEMSREQISTFADGELTDGQVDSVLAAIQKDGGCADWELYHRIGDVLRSDDMDVQLSSGFSERMAARLALEPAIVAPMVSDRVSAATTSGVATKPAAAHGKRWALPGMVAAAAAATVAMFTAPQLMVATSEPSRAPTATFAAADAPITVVSADAPEGVVLRDPRINEYLLAHQRFSPSVYSTAQYARSATFATDTNK